MPNKEFKELNKSDNSTKSKNVLDIKNLENKWRVFWEKEKIYSFKKHEKIAFSIDVPPPTVSGKMHAGHAFSYSQMDFLARFRRMFHGNIFYPFGTDDNGLPTEKLVEKINNVKSKNMSRADFIELCLKTLEKIKGDFIEDWKKIGVSCDYNIYYSTIDEHSQRVSQMSFVELYKKGLVYSAEFPTLFCVNCQTPIAQAELEDKQEQGLFTTIEFKLKDSKDKEKILIATTRPEFLAACVSIFVNPKDKRYKKIIGRKVIVPLFEQEVEIIADNSADMEKGTGAMMICSYGDKYDVEAIQKKKIKPRIILNYDGTLNELAGNYKGMKIKEARIAIINDLKSKGFVNKQELISHVVNVHDKCGFPIEFLSKKQWFIKVLGNKKDFIKQGKKIKWYPEFMRKRYENWINGLEWDWSISRDRHFGVPIPLWNCKKCGEIILADEKNLPVDPLKQKPCKKCKCGSTDFEPEKDVLDTWATSSMTPTISLALIEKNSNKMGKLIPMSLRPQAHDIIRTWAFYTIVKAFYHYNEIPWKEIAISGFVTLQGKKMSKSQGNVIEPQEIMEKYGADALRFCAASSKLGEDLEYQEKDVVTAQKTIVKLWNASKFISAHIDKIDKIDAKDLEPFDLWLLSKLNKTIEKCTENFECYEYSKAKAEVENFFWHVFCDNYLEIVKKRIYNPKSKKENKSAKFTLYASFLNILKLFAPIMPYITEEIYQSYFRKHEHDKSIHLTNWPKKDNSFYDKNVEKLGDKAVFILSKVRQTKAKNKKSLKTEIILSLEKEKIKELGAFIEDFKAVTNAERIEEGKFKIKFL